jgi:hypothetical protein
MRNKKKYRDTASFGRRQEYLVIAELLKRDFDVYMTLVDDQGIDCVIRLNDERYLDIQIKARSKEAKQWNFFAAMSFGVRDNFYFIFYTEKNNNFWVIPSKDVKELGIENKSGKNAGKISLSLPKTESGDKASKFDKYKNEKGFAALRGVKKNG